MCETLKIVNGQKIININLGLSTKHLHVLTFNSFNCEEGNIFYILNLKMSIFFENIK